jgi:hypothetical protein
VNSLRDATGISAAAIVKTVERLVTKEHAGTISSRDKRR